MAFDFKKEYREFYLPKNKPELLTVPPMNFLAVRGMGDPNQEGGAYKEAIGLLYGIAFTIKMSKLGAKSLEGYFDFVVPPLDFSKVEYLHYEEGLCVQCMHLGPYDQEPATIAAMDAYARERGYETDFSQGRYHHEIYLSDARRCKPENLKTVIRHPIRAIEAE